MSRIRFGSELALLLTREVHDPGIGFMTITRVQMTPDLQQARVFYTALGDDKARTQQRPRARAGRAVSAAPDRLAAPPEARSRADVHATTNRLPARTASNSC